jgi:alpha-tubulin suppressor-like RCC1 family protein
LADGTLLTAGNVPAPPPGANSVVESIGGIQHAVARLADGTLVAWGDNHYGQCNIPPFPPGLAVVQLATREHVNVARMSDGTLFAWHANYFNYLMELPTLPAGKFFDRVSAGYQHMLALRRAAPLCGSCVKVCSAAANSVNPQGAFLTAQGCVGISANNLVFDLSGLPPLQIGTLFYGSTLGYAPFGNGRLCAGGAVQRAGRALIASASGTLSIPVDLSQPPFSSGPQAILPGSHWNFQFWYRDPGGAPGTTNLSNALHVVFAP